jgi:hypothetical protein
MYIYPWAPSYTPESTQVYNNPLSSHTLESTQVYNNPLYKANNKRQVAKEVAQPLATSSKLYTLTSPTITMFLLPWLCMHIPNRIGPVRGGFVNPWRMHRQDLNL